MNEWTQEQLDNMTAEKAIEILQPQVDAYYRGGNWRPRSHFAKALEIAIQALKNDKGDK